MKESDQIVQYVQKKKKLEKQKLKKQQKREKTSYKLANTKVVGDDSRLMDLGVINLFLSPLIFGLSWATCRLLRYGYKPRSELAKEYLLDNPEELEKAKEVLNTDNVDYIAQYMVSNSQDAGIVQSITGCSDYINSIDFSVVPEALLITAAAIVVPFAGGFLVQHYREARYDHLIKKADKLENQINDINKQLEQCEEDIEQNKLVLKKC